MLLSLLRSSCSPRAERCTRIVACNHTVYPQVFVEKVNKSVMMNSNRLRHEAEKKKQAAAANLQQSVQETA